MSTCIGRKRMHDENNNKSIQEEINGAMIACVNKLLHRIFAMLKRKEALLE